MNNALTTVSPQGGSPVAFAGGNYRILIAGEQTSDAYSVVEMLVAPGGGPPPHRHPTFQEAFYVVEGRFEIRAEGAEPFWAEPGAFINIPFEGPVHQFRNRSETPGKLLCILTKAGMEQMFLEGGVPAEVGILPAGPPPPPDRQRMLALAQKYETEIFPPGYLGA